MSNPFERITDENCSSFILEVSTPKRESHILSPECLIEIEASPLSKRYSSARKFDFRKSEEKKSKASCRKLNFM